MDVTVQVQLDQCMTQSERAFLVDRIVATVGQSVEYASIEFREQRGESIHKEIARQPPILLKDQLKTAKYAFVRIRLKDTGGIIPAEARIAHPAMQSLEPRSIKGWIHALAFREIPFKRFGPIIIRFSHNSLRTQREQVAVKEC